MSATYFSASWYRVAHLRLRLRAHVEVEPHRYRGRTWYVLRDLASGKVHRFTPQAYVLLHLLDGTRTVEQAWEEVADRWGDHAPGQDDVVRLLARLHEADLLQTEIPPVAAELARRWAARKRSSLTRKALNPLSITVPLVDPSPVLVRFADAIRRVPARLLALAYLAWVLPAAALAFVHWDEVWSSIPDQVLSGENLLLVALCFPIAKTIHELGHGVAARALGAEVREAGVMLLVFYPSPYIDVSGAAAFRRPADRVLVGAAGMLAEIALAAGALYFWLVAEPGVLRAAAFSIIMIAGVSTILVNANPLLRFDGYFILCDLVDMPNLGSRSNKFWTNWIDRTVLAIRQQDHDVHTGSERFWLATYAPLSLVYRIALLVSIALFVAREYPALGGLFALWSLAVALGWPLLRGLRHVLRSSRTSGAGTRPIAVLCGGAAALAVLLFAIPFPVHTVSPGVTWIPDEAVLRSRTNGFASAAPAASDVVSPGVALLTLSNPELDSRLQVERARVAELTVSHSAEQFRDPAKAALLVQELDGMRAREEQAQGMVERLTLRSRTTGRLDVAGATDLPGRFLKEGDLIGYVIPDRIDLARIAVSQDDLELLRSGITGASAIFMDRPWQSFAVRLVREVPAGQNDLPSKALALSSGGTFATDPADRDGRKALQRVFQLEVAIVDPPADLKCGLRLLVRFEHRWEALGWQAYRRVRQLFLARLDA